MEFKVLLILAWAFTTTDADQPYNPCDVIWPGATYIQKKCILSLGAMSNNGQSVRDDAAKACSVLAPGGRLVETRTKQELDAIYKLSSSNFDSSPNTSSSTAWVGARDKGSFNFYWDSDGNQFSAVPWASDEPNQFTGVGLEPCVVMSSAGLHDAPCTVLADVDVMCELAIGNPCDTVYSGSVYIDGFCFKLIDGPSMWDDAKKGCEDQGAYLAELKTLSLVNDTLDYLKTVKGGHEYIVFIGGTDRETDGTFRWVTSNENFKSEMNASWISGDPNNRNGGETQWSSCLHSRLGVAWQIHLALIFIPTCVRRFLVVVPSMTSAVQTVSRKVYVTTGLLNVILKIETFIASNKTVEYGFASSSTPYLLEIDSKMKLEKTGIYNRTIVIHSWGSITVTFVSMTTDSAGGTIIYPQTLMSDDMGTGRFYFVPSTSPVHGSDNQLAVVAMDNFSDISMYFRLNGSGVTLEVDRFLYRDVTVAEITLEQYMTGYLQRSFGVDSLFVLASEPVSVLISFDNPDAESSTSDYVIESILPIEFIDTEYFTFPSFKDLSGAPCQDVFRLVAVYDNTTVEVSGTSTVTVEKAGNVYDILLDCETSYVLRGTEPFYVFKFSPLDTLNHPCMTSLLPRSVWRNQYDVIVTSQLLDFTYVSLQVIVKTAMKPLLLLEAAPVLTQDCRQVSGTDMSWCFFIISSKILEPAVYIHLSLTNQNATFGAYLYATGTQSAVCYALGVNEEAVPPHIFNVSILQPKPVTEPYNATCEFNNTITAKITNPTSTSDITTTTTVPTTTTENRLVSLAKYNLTLKELQELLDSIYEDLHVDVRTTSAYERRMISIPDERLSAKAIGSVGISFVIGALVLLVLPDVLKVLKEIWNFCQRLQGK